MCKFKSVIAALFLFLPCLSMADGGSDLEEEKEKAKNLTDAMQNAQLLLSDLSDAFDCDYASYDVQVTEMVDKIAYLVVIDVEDDTCDDMVKALNYEGAKQNLAFVSEREMPEMKPMPESGPSPFDEFNDPPMDYTLIHEVDPKNDH